MTTDNNEWEDLKADYVPSMNLSNKEGKPGGYFVGDFMETRAIKFMFKKEEREAKIHRFLVHETNLKPSIESDGLKEIDFVPETVVDVWGFGQLDYLLGKVELGDTLRVTYEGKPDKYHQCKVQRKKKAEGEKLPF